MNLRNFFTVVLLICIGEKVLSQNSLHKNGYRIELMEYHYAFFTHGKCVDTLYGRISDDRKIKINLLDCMGKMNVKCFNNKSILLENGAYVNSMDLLKCYTYGVGIGRRSKGAHTKSIEVDSYYQPLRNGIWYFYRSDGKLYMKKNYRKGILIDSTLINTH